MVEREPGSDLVAGEFVEDGLGRQAVDPATIEHGENVTQQGDPHRRVIGVHARNLGQGEPDGLTPLDPSEVGDRQEWLGVVPGAIG